MNEPNSPFDQRLQESQGFTTGKEWYESKTIKSALISIGTGIVPVVSMALMAFEIDVDIETQELMVNFVLMLISLAFAGGTIRGRLKAQEEIRPKAPNPPNPPGSGGHALTGFIMIMFCATILFVLTMLYSVSAQSAMKDSTYSFQAPTKRVDGSILPLSEIKHHLLRWSGPDKTSGVLITTSEKGLWTPPKVGEYIVTVETVDTEGRTSAPSAPVRYVASEIPPGPVPMAPVFVIAPTVPAGIESPPVQTGDSVRIPAQSYTGNSGWLRESVDQHEVVKAPPGPLNTVDPTNNARVDYLIASDGGTHTISFLVYPPDGMSDSVWLGRHARPDPAFNKGQPVFFPLFKRWTRSAALPLDLPPGQIVLSIFAREPGLMIAEIEIRKVVK